MPTTDQSLPGSLVGATLTVGPRDRLFIIGGEEASASPTSDVALLRVDDQPEVTPQDLGMETKR